MVTFQPSTRIVSEIASGDRSAAGRLMPLVYDELRALAASYLRRERRGHTLQPTALVHEAYLKMVDQRAACWSGRAHFFAVAAEAIRRILVDHARGRGTAKRGGGRERVTLSGIDAVGTDAEVDLIVLDDALTRLQTLHPRQAEVVKMRYFAGLTGAETAEALGVSRSTVVDDWTVARAWLLSELGETGA